jgi:hypothetical protein
MVKGTLIWIGVYLDPKISPSKYACPSGLMVSRVTPHSKGVFPEVKGM